MCHLYCRLMRSMMMHWAPVSRPSYWRRVIRARIYSLWVWAVCLQERAPPSDWSTSLSWLCRLMTGWGFVCLLCSTLATNLRVGKPANTFCLVHTTPDKKSLTATVMHLVPSAPTYNGGSQNLLCIDRVHHLKTPFMSSNLCQLWWRVDPKQSVNLRLKSILTFEKRSYSFFYTNTYRGLWSCLINKQKLC